MFLFGGAIIIPGFVALQMLVDLTIRPMLNPVTRQRMYGIFKCNYVET